MAKKQQIPIWHEMEILIPYTLPFDFKVMLEFFKFHEIGGTEKVEYESYSRVFEIDGICGFLHISERISTQVLVLKLMIQDKKIVPKVVERVHKMFDLNLNHQEMFSSLKKDTVLQSLMESYPALRVARGWDVFEMIVLTILGQVVSVRRAKDLMRKLVETHGTKIKHPLTKETFILFPTPAKLCIADLEHLGTTKARRQSLQMISALIKDKEIDLSGEDTELFKEKLLKIPGIGNWSVEYIALRGLGINDAFPGTDLALKRMISYYKELNLDQFRPWRSYVAIYLWKEYMTKKEKYQGGKS